MNRDTITASSRDNDHGVEAGDVFSGVYDELFELARRYLAREPIEHRLDPTDLVNEVYLRLVGDGETTWTGERHLVGWAARSMRQSLVERHRRRQTQKRGGCFDRVPLSRVALELELELEPSELVEALDHLRKRNAALVRVALLRLAGFSTIDCTEVMHCSATTVRERWAEARSFIGKYMSRAG